MAQSSFGGFAQPKKDSSGAKTGDATATAADIGVGKTAYGRNGKLTGTGANFGNATVGDVVNGKTFSSASGTLLTGTAYKRITQQIFTASGIFTAPIDCTSVTVTLVGGGGAGTWGSQTNYWEGMGGGGGYVTTITASVTPLQNYSVIVGAGGAGNGTSGADGANGSPSYFSGYVVNGGQGGSYGLNKGGDGGSGGGATRSNGGSNGGNGGNVNGGTGGTGQGTTTRGKAVSTSYAIIDGQLYSGGGGGGYQTGGAAVPAGSGGSGGGGRGAGGYFADSAQAASLGFNTDGTPNTGGGGGGHSLAWYQAFDGTNYYTTYSCRNQGGNGGSGIVIVTY
jgi:hypothetical protein